MHKYLKIKSGLFIPQEILKKLNIDGDNVKIDVVGNEIRIRSVKRKTIELIVPPFIPEKSMFFSIQPFKMGKIDHSKLDEVIYAK